MRYILDGHVPVPVDGLREWAAWMTANNQTIARDVVLLRDGEIVTISTAFLGSDHRVTIKPVAPVLFATLVLGGPLNEEFDRYETWEEAEKGHAAMVRRVKQLVARPELSATLG